MDVLNDNKKKPTACSAKLAMFPSDITLVGIDNNLFTACREKYQVGESNRRMYKNKEWRIMTSRITDVTVWGGRLFDCGEYELSSLLIERSQQLKTFTCFPAAGIHMARPLYCKNNRAGKFVFPVLEEMTMMDVGTPFDFGFIAPNLKSLEVILPHDNVAAAIDEWKTLTTAKRLFEESSNLDVIKLVTARSNDETMQRTEVLRIYTPHYKLWERRKLILLAMLKENPAQCTLARLPYDMLRSIYTINQGSFVIEENVRTAENEGHPRATTAAPTYS